jgi:hypothetical protein
VDGVPVSEEPTSELYVICLVYMKLLNGLFFGIDLFALFMLLSTH